MKIDSDNPDYTLLAKHNRYAMFMCYVSWLFLRINIRIGGKDSRDKFKEIQASIAKGILIGVNILFIIVPIIASVSNPDVSKILIGIACTTSLFLYFWVDSFESQYYPIFETFSKRKRRKWDLYVWVYKLGSLGLFGIWGLIYG